MGLKCRLPSTLRREPRRDPSMGQGEGGSFSFLGTAASAASVRAGEDSVLTPQEKREGLGIDWQWVKLVRFSDPGARAKDPE